MDVRKIRIFAALAGATAMFALGAGAGPAAADTAEVYNGLASGQALVISLFGQTPQLTFGVTKASAASTLTAAADAAGQLALGPSITHSAVSADGQSASQPEACASAALNLPSSITAIVNPMLACSSTSASVVNGAPTAIGNAKVAELDVSLNTVINQPALQPVVQPVLGALSQVTSKLPGNTGQTLNDLIGSVQQTKTLQVIAGATTSQVSTTSTSTVSKASALGAEIDILPAPLGVLNGAPLVKIVVGSSSAQAIYDRATGKSSGQFNPALVDVIFNPVLGLPEVKVPVGQTITILQGTPLESTIVAANGSNVTNPDGSVDATADAVSLQLLKGLPAPLSGGINITLAHAEAAAGGALATRSPAQLAALSPPDVPRSLARTGGNPWLPIIGFALLASAMVLRRVTVRAR
jgi:hypothetical protein